MNSSLKNFQANTSNWRQNLKRNKKRTYFVITIFILLYILLGLIIDLFLYSGKYPQANITQLFYALLSFKIIPYATLISSAVAAISLWISFRWHDKLILLGVKYHEVKANAKKTAEEQQLYNIIEEMKVAAGLRYMPRVFIINADYMNAFASGYSEKSAMVAITQGLMQKLNREELQAVMAHEISHIRHMDIKLTLMASVLSNIMLIMIDVLFYGVLFGRRGSSSDSKGGNALIIIVFVLRFLLPIVTVILMLFLSRTREYMADAGCVELMRDNAPLASALMKINADHTQNREQYSQDYKKTAHESIRREAYIFDPLKADIGRRGSLSDFFSTHPGIEKRLAALGFVKKS